MNKEEGGDLLRDALIWELHYEATHSREFSALNAAQDGDVAQLADLLQEQGLATQEAIAFVADKLRGKTKLGRPAKKAQADKELWAFGKAFVVMFTKKVGLEKAIDLCVEADPDLVEKESTFRTQARRGEKKFADLLNAYVQRHLARTRK